MKQILFSLLILISFSVSADEPPPKYVGKYLVEDLEPRLRKGVMIAVESYDASADVYFLRLTNRLESAVGPNRTPAVELLASVDTLREQAAKIRAKPSSIVGQQYKLDSDIPLLSDRGFEKQQARIKKSKNRIK